MFKKFIIETYKVLFLIVIIAVLFPIIILTPSDIGTIPYNLGIEIISYGGTLLGGFLTLFGVWWTINYQNSENIKHDLERKKELAIQYRPIFILKGIRIVFNSLNYLNAELELINKGRGEAESISFDLEYVNQYEHENHFATIACSVKSIVMADDVYKITLRIRNGPKTNMIYQCDMPDTTVHKFILSVKYKDLFGNEKKSIFNIDIKKAIKIYNDTTGNRFPKEWAIKIS